MKTTKKLTIDFNPCYIPQRRAVSNRVGGQNETTNRWKDATNLLRRHFCDEIEGEVSSFDPI